MKKYAFALFFLLSTVLCAKSANKNMGKKKAVPAPVLTTVKPVVPPGFSAFASYWAINKPCKNTKMWLGAVERVLLGQGLTVFDHANDGNISVAGFNGTKRVLVTVVCVPAPGDRTSIILNVFSDDGAINKEMGNLFRTKIEGIVLFDGC